MNAVKWFKYLITTIVLLFDIQMIKGQQNIVYDAPLFDDVMREILSTQNDSLHDKEYFNRKLHYYTLFYDALSDSVRTELFENSWHLWTTPELYFTIDSAERAEKLEFCANLCNFFERIIYTRKQQEFLTEYYESMKDSTRLKFRLDNRQIPLKKISVYCITKDSANNISKTKLKTSSLAFQLPVEKSEDTLYLVAKYRKKYFEIVSGQLKYYLQHTIYVDVFMNDIENAVDCKKLETCNNFKVTDDTWALIHVVWERYGYMVPERWQAIDDYRQYRKQIKQMLKYHRAK